MIKVEVVRKNQNIQEIKISGHADSGPKGYDLVCAAVSSIATGALNALDQIASKDVQLELTENPDAMIKIKVLQNKDDLQLLLNMLLIQLQTVQESQQKYIHIKEV